MRGKGVEYIGLRDKQVEKFMSNIQDDLNL
jgi:hypothetical protein